MYLGSPKHAKISNEDLLLLGAACDTCECVQHDEEDDLFPADLYYEKVGSLSGPSKSCEQQVRQRFEKGLVTYTATSKLPLLGPELHVGELWHLPPDALQINFVPIRLALHQNGISVKRSDSEEISCSTWSPFTLVVSCRMHTEDADVQRPWMRLFKIVIYHFGVTHLFATQGDNAEADRAKWVADISCTLRGMTLSLFPPDTRMLVMPLPGRRWTSTRLLAGYLLKCERDSVTLVFCELHAPHVNASEEAAALFFVYDDEDCDVRMGAIAINLATPVSERVGIDCSIFLLDFHHFCARSALEKVVWLRAMSNIKVKLKHDKRDPTPLELMRFRQAISDFTLEVDGSSRRAFTQIPMLPRAKKPVKSNAESLVAAPFTKSIRMAAATFRKSGLVSSAMDHDSAHAEVPSPPLSLQWTGDGTPSIAGRTMSRPVERSESEQDDEITSAHSLVVRADQEFQDVHLLTGASESACSGISSSTASGSRSFGPGLKSPSKLDRPLELEDELMPRSCDALKCETPPLHDENCYELGATPSEISSRTITSL